MAAVLNASTDGRHDLPHMRSAWRVAFAVLVGAAVVFIAGLSVGQSQAREPRVVSGTAYPNQDATAIALTPDHGPTVGFAVGGSPWQRDDGPWHDAGPSCLTPLRAGQRVQLGVLDADPAGSMPGGPVVVWMRCLSR